MCGGGGGGGGGNDATYYSNIENDRRNAEQMRADAQQAAADAEKAATQKKFDDAMAAFGTTAADPVSKYFADRGITPDADTQSRIIASIKNQIPNLDPNPEKYTSDDIIGQQVDAIQRGNRTKYVNQVNSTFAPGFEQSLIPDTSTQSIVDSILGEQRGTAKQIIDFNKTRGTVNDVGYNAALGNLDTQGAAGRSTLSDIAKSVVGKDRQGLLDIRGQAGDLASNYSFGTPAPDISGFYNRATTAAGTDLSGLEGSIRGAVGGTNFFDPATALQKGGTAQGPIAMTTGGIVPATDQRKRDAGRGLGSSGVF